MAAAAWLGSASASAQDWAKAMFDHTSKDLGVVARGATVEHTFTIENKYLEDVHVAAIRSSCGCTTPKVDKPLLKTYEKTSLVAVVDTRNYTGRKDVTLTVLLDKPFPAEVRLNLYCFIRSDVVFQPGSVQFGSVPQGTAAQRKVTVSYAGRANWRIVRVETTNPHLQAKATEVSRGPGPSSGSTLVTYDLVVQLDDRAPAGRLHEQLIVITDDPNQRNSHVPLTVEGMVVAPLTVSPSPLSFGPIAAGKSLTKPLVVHAKKPFRVKEVSCPNGGFSFKPPDAAPKVLQLIPVTFTAPPTPGKVTETIRIETDLSESGSVEVRVDALVVEPSGG